VNACILAHPGRVDTRPRQEVPGNRGGQFCMSAQIIAGGLPYENLIPVSGYFLPGTSSIAL